MAESSGGLVVWVNVHRCSTSYTPTALGHELPGRSKYPNLGCVMGMECIKTIQAVQSQGSDMTRSRGKDTFCRQNSPQPPVTICLRGLGIAQLSLNSEQS